MNAPLTAAWYAGEAARIVHDDEVNPEGCDMAHRIADALCRAHAAGLREAQEIVSRLREDDNGPHDLRDARDAISLRAREVERS